MSHQKQPHINDFLNRLYTLRDNAIERAQRAAKAIAARNSARGLLKSGATLTALADLIEAEFDGTLSSMLADLRHASTFPELNYDNLRDQTFLRAQDLIQGLIGASDLEKWFEVIGRGSAEDAIRSRLEKMLPHLKYRMRQFEVGLDQGTAAMAKAVTNNIINARTITGVVQQAGIGSTLNASPCFDATEVSSALKTLETEIALADVPNSRELRQLSSELATVRAQLSAPEPRHSVIREAGHSIRNMAEGAAGGVLTPAIVAAATAVWRLIGG